MQNVKVAIWGLGAMGSGVASTLLTKKGVDIVGVCVTRAARAGKSLFEVLGVERAGRADIILTNDINVAVKTGECDVCVVCTDSFTKKVEDKIITLLEKKVNVITIAEEMAYTQAQTPEIAKRFDEVARKNGVSVMGTGIIPGLVLDLLAICLSGAMTDIETVFCERVNSLSPFGESVMHEQGVGTTVAAFEAGCKDGTLSGHVGFAESVMMISDAMGLGVDKFEQQMAPIVTDVDRKSPYGFAKAGDVAGVRMTAQGFVGGKEIVTMSHPQQIEPEQVGVNTGDYVVLKGTPNVSMAIKPEINGGIGTIAMAVNCIPHIINARPGLRSMIDIPVPHVIMGDFRDMIDEERKIVK